jgi:hypothetical protein
MKLNFKLTSSQTFILMAALSLMLGEAAFATCKMSRDPKFNYYISPENQTVGMFTEGGNLNQSPTVVERCQSDAGSFLMVSLGVRRPGLNSDTSDVSFDGKLSDSQCRINNSFSRNPISFLETAGLVRDQHRILRTCTYLQIYDLDGRPLNFKNVSPSCRITTLDNNIVRAEGDYCFFRLQAASRFAISAIVKPECRDPDFLKANHINPQDIEASLNTYVTGDDTGMSSDVTPIGATKVRLYIAPYSNHLNLSDDFGPDVPRFPSDYGAEIHMGGMKIRGSLGNYVMDMSLQVDNIMQRTCKNGFCTSPADFDIPVVGEVELNEVKAGGKMNYIDGWWHAGLVPARWQGLLRTAQHNLNEVEFKPGRRYSMTVTFIDPYEDFALFRKGMQQLLIDLRGVQGTAGIDSIQPLSSLGELIGLPNLENLPTLSSPDMSAELGRIIETLQRMGQDRQWPYYYDRICDSRRASCIVAGKQKYFLKLTTEFTVDGQDDDNMELRVRDIVVKRDSPKFENYTRRVQELPGVVCGEAP